MIHVLAEQGTLDGTSDKPGYLRGFGIMPAESVRRVAKTAKLKPLPVPTDTNPDPGYRPTRGDDGVCAVAGSDVSVAGVR